MNIYDKNGAIKIIKQVLELPFKHWSKPIIYVNKVSFIFIFSNNCYSYHNSKVGFYMIIIILLFKKNSQNVQAAAQNCSKNWIGAYLKIIHWQNSMFEIKFKTLNFG